MTTPSVHPLVAVGQALAAIAVVVGFSLGNAPVVGIFATVALSQLGLAGVRHLQPSTLPALLLALAASDLARLTGLWPCDVACQGGAYYQAVAGVSVVWLALVFHLALAALAIRDARRGAFCAWTVRLCWLLGGVAAFFLIIADALGLACHYCRLVHHGALVAIIVVSLCAHVRERWWRCVFWALIGWLLINAGFHHVPVADVRPAPSGTTPTVTPTRVEDGIATKALAGCTRGRADAMATLELVLDLHCTSCAKLHDPLLAALAPALADGRLRVVIHHLVRSTQPVARDAVRLVLAAAVVGEHQTALATLLGSNPASSLAGLRERLTETVDIAAIDAVLRDHPGSLDLVIDADARRLAELKVGAKTPTAVLLRDGKEVTRWSGDFAPTLVVDALGR